MRKPFAILAVLALGACGDDPAPEAGDDDREASGEVLEGTISDAMLPIDELRSQAPLAEPEPGEGGGSGGSAAPAEDGEDAQSDTAPAEPEPADEPAAEPVADPAE